MKAFVLAAGLGTRLKPWTLSHPKALVPVGGIPMLGRVLTRLKDEGFVEVVGNVDLFSGQIVDFLLAHDFGLRVRVSDESGRLLDTGGGLLQAAKMLVDSGAPFLVHNVDILSDAPLAELMKIHRESGRDISLVTSGRESTRKLVFDTDGNLRGWHNLTTGEYKPEGFHPAPGDHEAAFSGIYIVGPSVKGQLAAYSGRIGDDRFPVMDFFLDAAKKNNIGEIKLDKLNLIDIGKPDTLRQAEGLFPGS